MFRQTYTTLALIALAAATTVAQESPAPPASSTALTLRAAVSEALERNAELIALRRAYNAARAAPAQEAYLAPPMFETQIWGWPVTTLNPTRTDMYMFMAEQELPGRGKRAARVLVGEREAEMSRQQIAVRANAILAELKQTYVDLSVARGLVTLYEQQAAVLRDMAEATTLRYASGQGAQHHTVTTLVELTRLQQERIKVDERIQIAEARLNTLIGRPPDGLPGPLAPIVSTTSVADAERLALERHPGIALAGR
jgi:outer membrane protein TolC